MAASDTTPHQIIQNPPPVDCRQYPPHSFVPLV
ncbi:hypothetical protein [Salmonella enterica]|nr:hypothetical protein [Salmonella enterica]UMY46331.1 hypothetical protein MLB75_15835 [Salmonella enterica]